MDKMSVLDTVFDRFLQSSHIFRNREVLRHDYIPTKLPHREEQIKCLGEMTAPVLKNTRCSNIFIYGKTGTGKTAVTRYVLNRIFERASQLGAPVSVRYVNCRLAGTTYRILLSLCEELNLEIPFTGLATGEVFSRFKEELDFKKRFLIVILDEIDTIVKSHGDTLLYDLTRINEMLLHGKITLIGISNDLRFKELLDPRVLSCLSEEEIVFRPYNASELQDILFERTQQAFFDGAILDGAIGLCAALAAAEHGDARRALDLLRVAGELAERQGAKNITEDLVRQAEERIEHNRVVETIVNLPVHSKIILCSTYLLCKAGIFCAITGDIYEIYENLCRQLTLSPLTQRRVSGLINELDMMGLLNARVVSMGRYGRTKKIRLGVKRNLIRQIFAADGRLDQLIDSQPQCLPPKKADGLRG